MSGALQNSSTTNVSRSRGQKHNRSSDPPVRSTNRPIQPQPQNWLARFLHIKPAVKILAFQISKVRARKEIARIWREWRRYGMRDVSVDKVTFRIWARVGEENREFFSFPSFVLFSTTFPCWCSCFLFPPTRCLSLFCLVTISSRVAPSYPYLDILKETFSSSYFSFLAR